MTRYPNAYSTPSHRGHIAAVEGNLNSAKLAQREIQDQQKSMYRAFSPPSKYMCFPSVHWILTKVFNNRARRCDEAEMKTNV